MHPHDTPKPRVTDALDEAQQRCDAGLPLTRSFDREANGHMETCAGMPSRLGFKQISVDLIYNLPAQTPGVSADEIHTLIETSAAATSVYALIWMAGSDSANCRPPMAPRPIGLSRPVRTHAGRLLFGLQRHHASG